MGLAFIPLYDYDSKQEKWRKFAWIGPEKNLRAEPRRSLNMKSKREILVRQKNKCRFCGSKITLEPYCNADADHIIPINYGGETNPENMQLLCVGCHRHKTSLENSREKRIIHLSNFEVGSKETIIVYSSNPRVSRPLDMRNPLDIEPGSPGSIHALSYKKRRKGFQIDVDYDNENEDINIFDRFKYTG